MSAPAETAPQRPKLTQSNLLARVLALEAAVDALVEADKKRAGLPGDRITREWREARPHD